ncbi:MAG: Glu/Leu/Phe/Val dehydrogenase dimerization domain-containing protein, partial [Patescibacteria group bacterium]
MENKSKNYYYIEPKIGSNIFEAVTLNNHEKLIFGHDKESGLRIVLAIHNTILGPSTGGTRIANVSEEKAIEEALRLSYAMTYKNAIIDEPFGGSKAVIIGDPSKPKSKQFLHAIGDFIESLRGTFLTGVDMGLSLDDAKVIAERTKYIFNSKGCSGETTAHGVFKGIE